MTTRQLDAVELLAYGASDLEVATALSVNLATIRRWKREGEFAQVLAKFLDHTVQDTQDRCKSLAAAALNTVVEIMRDGPPREKLAAGLKVLELAGVRGPKGDAAPADTWTQIFQGPVQMNALPALTNPYLLTVSPQKGEGAPMLGSDEDEEDE